MEVFKRVRCREDKLENKKLINDKPRPHEGSLQLSLNDLNYISVGDVRIYLDYIEDIGENSGVRRVKLMLIGPKEIRILRWSRDGTPESKHRK